MHAPEEYSGWTTSVTTDGNAAYGATMARAADGPEALIGRVIADRFRVDAVLGEGGMGAVLRCHHLGLGRDVAVKVLRPELGDDAEVTARFEREAKSASRLDHPNCVRVLDFGHWTPYAGAPAIKYLAMQLLEGHELGDMLARPLPAEKVIDYGMQVLAALDHAHRQGVIHRDLKPENVFVTYDHEAREVLKLVDFGIAKLSESVAGSPKLTRAGLVFGTPRYMSPEQASGGNVDARTDLYSLGVIMYQMLTARLPFESDDLVTLMRKQILEDPEPLPDEVPARLRAVVEQLMAKDRNARQSTAAEVRAGLEQALAELGVPVAQMAATSSLADRLVTASQMMSATSMASTPIRVTQSFGPSRASVWRTVGWVAAAAGLAAVIAWAAKHAAGDPSESSTMSPQELEAKVGAWLGKPAGAASGSASAADESPPGKAALDVASLLAPKAPPHSLAAVDRNLARGDHSTALAGADALLVQFDGDAQVHLRRARALAKTGGAKALVSYSDAVERDPTLLDDPEIAGEVLALLRKPELRKSAVDTLLAGFGGGRDDLMLELVNSDRGVFARADRHRLLAQLGEHPDFAKLVDRSLQQALDLWQAGQAEAPCPAFAEALDAIEKEPSAYVVGTLHRVVPPVAAKTASTDERTFCASLGARLAEVRTKVDQAHPTPEAEWKVPADYVPKKKKRRRGFFGRLFR
ncbi:MAG TPA: serine/threonine-protein kinase [Nannocystaceae bacterium]|nr:serine/threonine-protein kinase [Nannocystaceae bacterium]